MWVSSVSDPCILSGLPPFYFRQSIKFSLLQEPKSDPCCLVHFVLALVFGFVTSLIYVLFASSSKYMESESLRLHALST